MRLSRRGLVITAEQRTHCQEVSLAVVMCGGVSLAIYMNGLARELLRLVRAAAVADRRGDPWNRTPLRTDLGGTEKVYRRLGQILQRRRIETEAARPVDAPILTNVVIDILSGASAGGINAVCLARALVVDVNLQPLRDLWFDEGDIARLVHDNRSTRVRSPTRSLLPGIGSDMGGLRSRPESMLPSIAAWRSASKLGESQLVRCGRRAGRFEMREDEFVAMSPETTRSARKV